MKIAFVSRRLVPEYETGVQQTFQTVRSLLDQGAAIDLVMPRKWSDLFRGRAEIEEAFREYSGIRHPALAVTAVTPSIQFRPLLERLTRGKAADIEMLTDLCTLLPVTVHLMRSRPDLVYSRRWSYLVVASNLGLPVAYETHTTKSSAYLRLLARRRNLLGVITHSQLITRALRESGFPEEALLTGYNCCDLPPVEERPSKREARVELGLAADEPVVCYTGRLKARKHPEALLDLARRLPGVRFLLVGRATAYEAQALQRAIGAAGLRNVQIMPWVPPPDLPNYLYAADILIIPPTARPLQTGRTVLPIKTFLYLAAGRPIVAPALRDIMEILEHDRNAVLVPPDDLEACAEQVEGLLADRTLAERLSRAALTDSSRYTCERRAELLCRFLAERIESRWRVDETSNR